MKELQNLNEFDQKQKVVLAVSGGVDSIVLFHLMREFSKENDVEIVVAHVNHQLRDEADAEEEFVKKLVETYKIPFYVHRWLKKDQPQTGTEEAARNMRYQFFKEVMNQTDASILMTAHHQDDQVETILMKLTRGSTLEQITGIERVQPFHKGYLVRPLLSFSKETIYDYAHRMNLHYKEDLTNQELLFSRNRFRNQIIPLLKEENRQFNEHVEQFSSDLRDVLQIAKGPIEEAYKNVVKEDKGTYAFQIEDFYQLPPPLQRAMLKLLLENLYKKTTEDYKTTYIQLIIDWLKDTEGHSKLHLTADMEVKKSYNNITFKKRTAETSQSGSKAVFTLTESNETIQLSENETLSIRRLEKKPMEMQDEKNEDAVDYLILPVRKDLFPLTIRHRQPGDRMSYQGLKGSKKIKDIFIDEKVPLEERENVWLVEDKKGRILWLIGFRKMYLLSDKETDKLTYILKYKNNKLFH